MFKDIYAKPFIIYPRNLKFFEKMRIFSLYMVQTNGIFVKIRICVVFQLERMTKH